MSRIHFIGGEKGGVGKSVVARLLAQYWIDKQQPWAGFDTDRSHGALLRYYGDFAQPVEVTCLEELDRLVESAAQEKTNVLVDLAAQSDRDVHAWIANGGLLELAKELGIEILFWHVMDDGKDSVNLLAGLLERYGDSGRYAIVLNHGRGDDFRLFIESSAKQRAEEFGAAVMELKALHKPTMRRIDQCDKSFWAALNNTDPERGYCLGLMERQRMKIWLRSAYGEFARIGV